MATTLQGARELQTKILQIRRQLKSVSDAAQTGYNLAGRIALGDESELGFRIRKGESPKAQEIPALQQQLAGLKAQLTVLVGEIEVPTEAEFIELAETANPE